MKEQISDFRKYSLIALGVLLFQFFIGCAAPPAVPIINTFSANPPVITESESAVLSWSVTDATSVSINNGIGSVATTGNTTVSPTITTTYMLTATNTSGSVTSTTTITVDPLEPVILINYPMDPADTGGDNLSRGFYIEQYPGTSLTQVDLWVGSATGGNSHFELIVREDTYDGTVLYVSQATKSLPADVYDKQLVTFDFPSTAIEKNSTVTFSLNMLSGPTGCSYAVHGQYGGIPDGDRLVTQTHGTTAPLDTSRRNGIAIRVYGHE